MNLSIRVATVAVILLLLPIPSLFDYHFDLPTKAFAAPSAPDPPTAIALTNSSYNNYFLHGLPSKPSSVFSSNSRPLASGVVVAWRNTEQAGYVCNPGQPTVITYSSLNASSGKLVPKNLTAPLGYRLPPCIDANAPRGSDDGQIFTQVLQNSNSTSPRRSILVLDAQDGKSSVIPCPNPNNNTVSDAGGGCGYGDPVVSTWGSYVLALKSYPRLFAWDFATGSNIWYYTAEIAQANGGQWQQLTPNDHYTASFTCTLNGVEYQSLIDLSTPTQVVARGPGQYAWVRYNYKPTSGGPCGPTEPGKVATSADILLENGELVTSFYPTGSYSGRQCSTYNDTICNFTIVGAWGNLVLYAVRDGASSSIYDLWTYDASKNMKIRLPITSNDLNLAAISGISSDGRSLIMNNNSRVLIYDPSFGIKVFSQNATLVRVSNGWAFWQNMTGDVNLFDLSRQRLYSEDNIRGATSGRYANLPVTVDFSDGVAAWVSIQLTGSQSPAYVPVLYVLDASHLDPATGNLTQVTVRVPLDWAKISPAGDYRLGEIHVSKGWVFLSAVPKWSNFLQIFAFQPLAGRVGVTVNGTFLPLNEVRVDVMQYSGATAKLAATTYTDDHGAFAILLPESLSTANPPYSFVVNLTQKDDKFKILDYSGNNSVSLPHVVNSTITMTTSDLSVIRVSENFVSIDFTKVTDLGHMTTTASRISYARDAAYNFYIAFQAYQLLRDVLNSGYMMDRTLQIRIFSRTRGTFFFWQGNQPYMNLPLNDSVIGGPNAPMNTVWHEFGHAVMWFSPVGGSHAMPVRTGKNHGGYANPSSIDAWTEGWAEYYSTLVAHYIDKRPDAQLYKYKGGVINLGDNLKNWAWLEELSVSSTLWDISTSWSGNYNWNPGAAQNPHPNAANIPITQLWATVTSKNVENVYQLWQTFKTIPGVNQSFVARDIYNDTNGNARWDPGEPIGVSSWAVITTAAGIDQGTTNPDAIAEAQHNDFILINNTGRRNRQDLPVAPGSAVLLNLTDSETGTPIQGVTVKVTVSDPESSSYTYNFTLQQESNTFYLYLPGGRNETASVTVGAQGYTGTRTFSVTSNALQSNIFANLYQNRTKPYIMQVNGSLTRNHTVLKDYILTAVTENTQYTIDIVSNSTISSQSFDSGTSTIFFQGFTPVGHTGFVNVTMPLSMNNGTFTLNVNKSPAQFSPHKTAVSNELTFTMPAGQSSVSITLQPSSAKAAQPPPKTTINSTSTTTSTPHSETTSGRTTTTETSGTTTNTSTSSTGREIDYLLIIGAIIVLLIIIGLIFMILKRKR